MPRWKKITTGVALLAVVTGGVMTLVQGEPAPTGGDSNASGLAASLIETPEGTGGAAKPATEEPASKGIFRLGFSFIAGFSIGTFLRAVLKLAAFMLGFWLVMTMLLSYSGLVEVKWDEIQALWDQFRDNIGNEWGNFQTFMLGSLPATGLAVTGLAIGLKRH